MHNQVTLQNKSTTNCEQLVSLIKTYNIYYVEIIKTKYNGSDMSNQLHFTIYKMDQP